MTNYIKSEGYIFVNLCNNVAQALYAAMIQKGWSERTAQERAHRGDRTLQDITKILAELGAHMEVTVRFIDAPVTQVPYEWRMEGKKDE